ncbi:MAG: heme ABC transporter ATP-binding protein [Sneathiella sp.]|nr:heme ABC transporter ATP-binding protein [Sneathiella sp.]
MLRAENVSFSVHGKEILNGISLDVEASEIVSILGPNGAGKSTLLKCLAGFQPTSQGSISINGADVKKLSGAELAGLRAVLTQQVSIGFPISAREVVALGRAAKRNAIGDSDKIIDHAMALTGTTEFADRSLSTLSGGEQQRLHLARVIAQIWDQESAVLFLDEPTSALDLKHQFQLFDVCRNLCEQRNFSVVAILHDLKLAKEMTDKALLLKSGQTFASGKSREILTSESVCPLYEITSAQFELI